jgi:predicted F0F1-ATPase subunit
LNKEFEEPIQTKWQERIWILAVAGQAGFLIAFPVIVGVGVGIMLDRQFNTIILFTILLATAGFGAGAFLVYRWVKTTVYKRLQKQKKEE